MGLMDRDYMHKRWQEAENAPPMIPPRLNETIFRENRKMDEPAQPNRNWIRSPKIPAFRGAVILWVMTFAAYIYMANQRAMALPKELAKYALTPQRALDIAFREVRKLDRRNFDGRKSQLLRRVSDVPVCALAGASIGRLDRSRAGLLSDGCAVVLCRDLATVLRLRGHSFDTHRQHG